MNNEYVKKMVCFEESLQNAENFIKENLDINTKYDIDNNTMYLWCEDINKTNHLNKAKKYLIENIGEDLIQIEFGQYIENGNL